jgi:hypothetical protein
MERGISSGVREGRGSGSDGGGSIGGIITNTIDDTGEYTDVAEETGEIENGEDGEDNTISRFPLIF